MIGNYLNLSNAAFVDRLYEEWREDPASIDPDWREYFDKLSRGELDAVLEGSGFRDPHPPGTNDVSGSNGHQEDGASVANGSGFAVAADPDVGPRRSGSDAGLTTLHIDPSGHAYKQSRVNALIWSYRDIGYLYADTNPLKGYLTPDMWYMRFAVEGDYETLALEDFGLTEDDLETPFLTGRFIPEETLTLSQIQERMRQVYCGHIGAELLHIQNKAVRNWLIKKLEGRVVQETWTRDDRIEFQKDLIRAEEFERFIHSNFIGQKRFSLEGGEAVIPGLHYLFTRMARAGVEESIVGMAHRGRLNVFVNAMGKPAVDIFARFVDNYAPHTYGGSGDVKYHLGFSTDFLPEGADRPLHIGLVANPSHLEAVDPVVEGKARAVQRRRKDKHRKKVVPVLIHGDSAFAGQGVVAETLNLSQLKGYRTGGTIHIIINNQIGFTTASQDSRSTFFTTDIAKSIAIPIFHVNGDDPESVVTAFDLAFQHRQKFGQDVIIDIICYRRLGHNEADEPSFSHPRMYARIKDHQTSRAIYGDVLVQDGTWSEAEQEAFAESYRQELKGHLQEARDGYEPSMDDAYQGDVWRNFKRKYSFDPVKTQVDKKVLGQIADKLTTVPDHFHLHSKLERFATNRAQQFTTDTVDWGFAEAMAFGSLLAEGHDIRLSGEDCRRGTFSHRHAVWWDVKSPTPKSYVPLRFLQEKQGEFSVYDSPLSEFSVLGFDYGYSLATPNGLTIWEGQFGDFVNGAQVIIDQFIVSSETKWFRSSGLVMLLPHGYEGQGPEHSSAFYERFLSLCADYNIQVVNLTTPAQYFHCIRRQMKQDYRKPLVVMSPKSLLRLKECVSPVSDFTSGYFHTVLDDDQVDAQKVKRVLICSGKVYYDLLNERTERNSTDTAIVRLEQAYPFPKEELKAVMERYPKASMFRYVQEETENRGAWMFVHYRADKFLPDGVRLEYAGRSASPSPATGSHKQHMEELKAFMDTAFSG